MFADRYTAAGSLDTTFAQSGRLLVQPFPYEAGAPSAHDSSVGSDGAIAFSDFENSSQEMGVGLLRPDGTPDPTFGGAGYRVPTSMARPPSMWCAMAPEGSSAQARSPTARQQ